MTADLTRQGEFDFGIDESDMMFMMMIMMVAILELIVRGGTL